MNFPEISKDTVSLLFQAYGSLANSPLNQSLRALLDLRISQVNDCDYCYTMHMGEATKLNVDSNKIKQLPNWRNSDAFDESEKEALAWAEALTNLSTKVRVEDTKLASYFSEREIVDITISISITNAFNRMVISMQSDEKK